MRTLLCFAVVVLTVAVGPPVAAQPAVTTPTEHLGRVPGVDFELADWGEVRTYFKNLGDESPNAVTTTIGTTTEGREFLLTVISSAENLARLDQLKAYSKIICDPRGRTDAEKQEALENGKVFLFVSCAMHATETAAPQFAMEFAYALATSDEEPWASARDNVVVGLFPCLNPDGLDHVVDWYRRTVGTPYEATGLLKLYQYYAGHDNNRDWFMLTQAETRIVTEQLYSVWFPQVYWDVHQQGSSRERMFVPPFRDPLNPNLDPAIISGIDALGSRALLDMTRDGLSGVSTGVSYDMWWNGGNRNVPVRHNIIGLLTEAASVRIASPIFLPRGDLSGPRGLGQYAPSNRFPDPWPGGWWRLRDIIDYELAFGRSLLGSLAREPRYWLANALGASERVIRKGEDEAPRAWVIPSDNRDPAAVRRLVDVLLRSGVEVHVSEDTVEADGRPYPAGSLVILGNQPYGSHVKDLFEVQRYPESGPPPYDVSGWTLPALLGVRRIEVMHALDDDLDLERVTTATAAVAAFGGDPRVEPGSTGIRSSWDTDTWTALVHELAAERSMTLITTGERAGLFVAGAEAPEDDEQRIVLGSMPRIGLYSPWRGNMDEGWMRYLFDTLEYPYLTLRNEMLRAGGLSDLIDVLVIPSIGPGQLDSGRPEGTIPDEYAGGLAPEGAAAIEEFVRGGGTLIGLGSSTQWVIDLLRIALVDVTREPETSEFSCPGSVLRGVPAPDHAFTAGLPPTIALFFSSGASAWREMTEKERQEKDYPDDPKLETLLRYAPTRVLLSGWIEQPQVIEGRAGWVRAGYGKGRVHLFGFRPQYRGWTQAAFPLLLRALLFDAPGVEAPAPTEPAEPD